MSTQPLPPDHSNRPAFPMPDQAFSRNPFRFTGSVGSFGENRRDDLIKAQILLGNAGYYDLRGLGAPTGWPGGEIVRSIKRLQKDQGLPADGVMLPLGEDGVGANGEGETLAALQEQLGDRLSGYAAPTPDEVDSHYEERARRMTLADADPAGPISDIVVADEYGMASDPLGVIPPLGASPPAHPSPASSEGTMSDIDSSPQPQWQSGAQLARNTVIQRPGPRPNPLPGSPRPIPPRQTGSTPAPQQPELRQAPFAPSAGQQGRPLTREQEQQFRNLLREQEHERLDFRKNPLDRHPLREADPPRPQQAQAIPEPKRGSIVIAEDGKEVHVPPLDSWADELDANDRDSAEALNNAIAVEMAKLGVDDRRGSKQTQMEINVYIRECLKVIKEELPGFKVTHVFGGTQDGKGEKYRKEEHLWNHDENGNPVRTGSRRPDFTLEIARNFAIRARGNTVDVRNGEITGRETRAGAGIEALTEGDRTALARKAPKNTDPSEIRAAANKFCRDLARNLRQDFEKLGEFDKPAPAAPAQYQGPASARKAAEKRARVQ